MRTCQAASGTLGVSPSGVRTSATDTAKVANTSATAALTGAELVRYLLGAKLRECCGGVVHLALEALDPAALPWLLCARRLAENQLFWGRIVVLDRPAGPCRVLGPKPEEDLDAAGLVATARAIIASRGQSVALLPVGAAPSMLVETSHPRSRRGKEPEAIAVAIAAETLALRTAQSDRLGAGASALCQETVRA